MLDKSWISGIPSKKLARYQPVTNCTYWKVLGSYNNWNIIDITPKWIPYEAFDEINGIFIHRISKNVASLVWSGMYGNINTDDTTTNGFYVIQVLSEACKLQNKTTIDGQVISAGKLFVKAQYLCSVQENTNWYWKQQPLQQTIMVTTHNILHPCLDVITIIYFQDIPKNVCNRIWAKKSIQRNPTSMTHVSYDYILDEIERRKKIEFERNVSFNSDEE